MQNMDALYETGFLRPGSSRLIKDTFNELIKQLRPHMIPIVETTNQGLEVSASVIGNEYGDIYEAMLNYARNSRLNKNKVPPFYNSLMKPVMTMKKAVTG